MINADRIQGVVVFGIGVALLVWLVPTYVTSMPGDPLNPAMFPRAAGWLLLVLGIVQVIFANPDASVPRKAEVFGFACFVVALAVAAWLLPIVGFIPVGCGLMVASLVLLRERRPVWAAVTLIGVPFFVWFLFTVLLARSLS